MDKEKRKCTATMVEMDKSVKIHGERKRMEQKRYRKRDKYCLNCHCTKSIRRLKLWQLQTIVIIKSFVYDFFFMPMSNYLFIGYSKQPWVVSDPNLRAKGIPLRKEGNTHEMNHYRPISIISSVVKVLESSFLIYYLVCSLLTIY